MSFFEKVKEKFAVEKMDSVKDINEEVICKANVKANRSFLEISLLYILIDIFVIILGICGYYKFYNTFVTILPYLCSIILNIVLLIIGFKFDLSGLKLKYALVALFMASNFIVSIYIGYVVCLLFIIPIILSILYYDYKFTIITSVVSELLIISSMFLGSLVWYNIGYYDLYFFGLPVDQIVNIGGNTYIDLQGITLNDFSSYLKLNTGILILTYTIIVLVVSCISIFSAKRGKEMLGEQSVISAAKSKSEKEAEEAKMRIMISQIQPHFLYNTLNSIYYLIEKNPETAQQAVSDFSDYLRENLNVKDNRELIPFSKELSHIKKYLALEKIRFEDELEYVIDVKFKNFRVPALSIQPLIENAVKHGVCKKVGGGTVKISTSEEKDFYKIVIEDDGVGFDPQAPLSADRSHIGLLNTKTRLESKLGAKMFIDSKIGHGTKMQIQIPKENYYEDTGD